jgi:hypothetical protein
MVTERRQRGREASVSAPWGWGGIIPQGDRQAKARRSVYELVPEPAHGQEVIGLMRVAFELAAQALHVHVQRAGVAEVVRPPDLLDQEVPREEPAFAAEEGLEQLELLRRQGDAPPTDLVRATSI